IDVSTDTTRYLPPETKMELAVQAIWSELLGQDNISVDANFFEIGGHSLLGIRLASACRERLGVELPLKVLMEGPTIRCLAEQCDWYETQRQVLACADQLSNEREDSERIVI
ncbi:phosphopantetheine-binding protein, partial [Colwellia sp. Bg11-12]|uniref:phosphopantetheine-binding protein n=1 Tax=Colwellia sp. Bg11-12 TaxID=2759817 RepID=UPI0017D9763A